MVVDEESPDHGGGSVTFTGSVFLAGSRLATGLTGLFSGHKIIQVKDFSFVGLFTHFTRGW